MSQKRLNDTFAACGLTNCVLYEGKSGCTRKFEEEGCL